MLLSRVAEDPPAGQDKPGSREGQKRASVPSVVSAPRPRFDVPSMNRDRDRRAMSREAR